MPIITLTSDWGYSSYYAGAVKGSILSRMPDAVIVDVTHGIEPFNLRETAFLLTAMYKDFPKGSIHIIGVDTEGGVKRPHTVVCADGHYFIGADNGVFTMLNDKIEKIVNIDIVQKTSYSTFSSRDVFVEVAVHIAEGGRIEDLGHVVDSTRPMYIPQSVFDRQSRIIKGAVIYIDSFGNLVTNITEKQIVEIVGHKSIRLEFDNSYSVREIHKAYSGVHEPDLVALVGSSGYLELAINKGNASQLLNMRVDDSVRLIIMDEDFVDEGEQDDQDYSLGMFDVSS